VAALEADMAAAASSGHELVAQLAARDAALAQLQSELVAAREVSTAKDSTIGSLTQDVAAAQASLASRDKKVGQGLRRAPSLLHQAKRGAWLCRGQLCPQASPQTRGRCRCRWPS
jgi:hypothetical protein